MLGCSLVHSPLDVVHQLGPASGRFKRRHPEPTTQHSQSPFERAHLEGKQAVGTRTRTRVGGRVASALELFGDHPPARRPERHRHAPRPDGGEEVGWVIGNEDDVRQRGWFLEDLEDTRGTILRSQPLGTVNDHHPARADNRTSREGLKCGLQLFGDSNGGATGADGFDVE